MKQKSLIMLILLLIIGILLTGFYNIRTYGDTIYKFSDDSSVLGKFYPNTKTLHIYGSGEINNYNAGEETPIDAIKEKINVVIVEESICNLGFRLLTNMPNLEYVVMGVHCNPQNSFSNCNNLKFVYQVEQGNVLGWTVYQNGRCPIEHTMIELKEKYLK